MGHRLTPRLKSLGYEDNCEDKVGDVGLPAGFDECYPRIEHSAPYKDKN